MKIEKRWENNRSKMISYIVFGAYLFLLTWLVLFKFAFTIEEIPHLRQLNLIPFHYETSVAYITHMKEVIYNILIFVPAGVYFTAFLGKRKWWLGIGASFFVSLTFETVQWIFSIGVSDITDLIMNTTGVLVGVGLYYLLKKIFKEKTNKIILALAAIVTILFVSLIIIILINN